MHVSILFVALLSLMTAVAIAGRANLHLQSSNVNSLYGVQWGIHMANNDIGWKDYFDNANAPERPDLAKFLMTPRALVLGHWLGGKDTIGAFVRNYIQQVTNGDHNIGVQFVIDNVRPWECDACNYLPRQQDIDCFQGWIDEVKDAIGDYRAIIIVQPDAYFATCAPHFSNVYKEEIKYAVNEFRQLPYASVYIDGESSDWQPYDMVASLLVELGVGLPGVRGFTLGQTHAAPDSDQYKFGRAVIEELKEKHGISNRYFIANRMGNGYPQRPGSKAFHENLRCTTSSTDCAAFGRPPYVYKHDKYCDGFLWFGTFGMDPPNAAEIIGMAQYSPFANALPPSSSSSSDAGYAGVLAKVVATNNPWGNSGFTAASMLRNTAGIPDRKGWYKKGDPKHSTPCQASLWKAPQLHPCKRSDFGKSPNGTLTPRQPFTYPPCLRKDPPGWGTYDGPADGIADPVKAMEYVTKREQGKKNACTGKSVPGSKSSKKGGNKVKKGGKKASKGGKKASTGGKGDKKKKHKKHHKKG